MLVKLKRDVFYDKLYKRNDWGTEIPDQFCDKLPADAVLLEPTAPPPPPPTKPKPVALSALNKKRAAATADIDDDDLA